MTKKKNLPSEQFNGIFFFPHYIAPKLSHYCECERIFFKLLHTFWCFPPIEIAYIYLCINSVIYINYVVALSVFVGFLPYRIVINISIDC